MCENLFLVLGIVVAAAVGLAAALLLLASELLFKLLQLLLGQAESLIFWDENSRGCSGRDWISGRGGGGRRRRRRRRRWDGLSIFRQCLASRRRRYVALNSSLPCYSCSRFFSELANELLDLFVKPRLEIFNQDRSIFHLMASLIDSIVKCNIGAQVRVRSLNFGAALYRQALVLGRKLFCQIIAVVFVLVVTLVECNFLFGFSSRYISHFSIFLVDIMEKPSVQRVRIHQAGFLRGKRTNRTRFALFFFFFLLSMSFENIASPNIFFAPAFRIIPLLRSIEHIFVKNRIDNVFSGDIHRDAGLFS